MSKQEAILHRISERLALPPEALGQESRILLLGTRELQVEGHGGIARYSSQRILLHGHGGEICVDGEGLQISFLSRDRIHIRGTIRSVTLEEEA